MRHRSKSVEKIVTWAKITDGRKITAFEILFSVQPHQPLWSGHIGWLIEHQRQSRIDALPPDADAAPPFAQSAVAVPLARRQIFER